MTDNFPSDGKSDPGPVIIMAGGIDLTPEVEAVLRHMFKRYGRLAIELEFGRGLSGSRVFKVRLTEKDGSAELPAVVKIAPVGSIEQEWRAYQRWVKNKLPKIAQLAEPPTYPPGSRWAGLRYSLVGGGTFSVQSLRDYYEEAGSDDLRWVLEKRLFKSLGPNWWWKNRTDHMFKMQMDYDILLPVNLVIKPVSSDFLDDVLIIEPDNKTALAGIVTGDRVQLKGLVITKANPAKQEITLNFPRDPDDKPSESFRIRLVDVPDVTREQMGQVIEPIYGQVTAIRHEMLVDQVTQALGETIDVEAERLSVPTTQADAAPDEPPGWSTLSLPNPLATYRALLQEFITVRISTIHGDLNMENILVNPETHDVEMIDFATVHRGHVLRDLLRLETEVVIMLIPPTLAGHGLPPATIVPFYKWLHLAILGRDQAASSGLSWPALAKPFEFLQTIRNTARQCLFNQEDWQEYYRGLTLYLLGALKFESLDKLPTAPLPKQAAFWGAAAAQHLLDMLSSTQKQAAGSVVQDPVDPLPDPVLEYGTMHPRSTMYVERAADEDCLAWLGHSRAVTLFIQAPWQMGKSSLISRMLHRVQNEAGKKSALIDFQKFPEQYFEDAENFLVEFCLMIGDALGIPGAIDRYWGGPRTNLVNCSRYLSEYLIPQVDEPFILALDEVERMLTSPFRTDFFGMLRTWHNDRVSNKSLAQMTLLLSSSTDPFLLIDNPHQSPFNVAEPILLQDFTRAEVEQLNRLHHSPLRSGQIDDLMELVGGHPFLTRLALYRLATGRIDLNDLLAQATADTGPFGQHLQHYRRRILREPELKRGLVHILRRHDYDEDLIFYRLNSAGLIRKVGQQVVFRNNLYARYFEERLINS